MTATGCQRWSLAQSVHHPVRDEHGTVTDSRHERQLRACTEPHSAPSLHILQDYGRLRRSYQPLSWLEAAMPASMGTATPSCVAFTGSVIARSAADCCDS